MNYIHFKCIRVKYKSNNMINCICIKKSYFHIGLFGNKYQHAMWSVAKLTKTKSPFQQMKITLANMKGKRYAHSIR